MARILASVSEGQQRTYFIALLVAICSLALSQIDFLRAGGFGILYLHRAFIFLSAGYFAWVVLNQGRMSLNRLDLAVLAFAAVICLRVLVDTVGPYPVTQSVTITVQLLLAVAFYLSVASLPVTQRRLNMLFRVWLLVVLAVTAYGFYQTFARNFGLPLANITIGSFYTRDANLFGFQRPTSIFKEPTHFSGFVLPPFVFLTYLFLKNQTSRVLFTTRRANGFVLVLCWCTFFMIASLGGYIALASTACLVALFNRRIRRLWFRVGSVTAVVFALVLTFGQEIELLYAPLYRVVHFVASLFGLLVSGNSVSGSIGIRLTRLYWTVVVWSKSPLFGIGINNIQYLTDLAEPAWYRGQSLEPVTHSVFGFVLSSAGLLGITAYGAIYVTGMRYVQIARARLESEYERTVVIALGYAVFGNAVTGFFSLPVTYPLKWFLLALLSLLVSYSIAVDESEETSDAI